MLRGRFFLNPGLDDLELFFTGPVSTTRSSRSHPLCCITTRQAGGDGSTPEIVVPLFLQGDKLNSLASASSAECIAPAWLIPVVEQEDSATMVLDTVEVETKMPMPITIPNQASEELQALVQSIGLKPAEWPSVFSFKAPVLKLKPLVKGKKDIVELCRTSSSDESAPKKKRTTTTTPGVDVLELIGVVGSKRAESRDRANADGCTGDVFTETSKKIKTKFNAHLLS